MSADGMNRRDDGAGAAAPRLAARKLGLRVSGTRIGEPARPAAPGPAAAAPRPHALGLRVHSSPLAERIARRAPAPAADDGGYAWDPEAPGGPAGRDGGEGGAP